MKHLLLSFLLLWPTVLIAEDDIRDEVPFILDDTRDIWVSLFEEPNFDVLDFSFLVSWRCGIEAIEFSVNDSNSFGDFPLLRCSPNQPYPWEDEDDIIAIEFPPDYIDNVTVRVLFPDGTFMVNRWRRIELEFN